MRSISHEEHVRISRVLVMRHGRDEAIQRLIEGTRANCAAMGVPDRFDEALTVRWAERVADAVEDCAGESYAEFIRAHPELGRSSLLGLPAWKTRGV
jgi:hypothetical protein